MENLTDLVELQELNLSKNNITIFEGVLKCKKLKTLKLGTFYLDKDSNPIDK